MNDLSEFKAFAEDLADLARPIAQRYFRADRAMLGQIETGKSVPTVTLAWKIAQALAVPVAALIEAPRAPRALVMPKARSEEHTSELQSQR